MIIVINARFHATTSVHSFSDYFDEAAQLHFSTPSNIQLKYRLYGFQDEQG